MPDSIPVAETLKKLPGALCKPERFLNATEERPWSTRRVKVAQQILSENIVLAGEYVFVCRMMLRLNAVLAGFQEVFERQVGDMLELLGSSDWAYVRPISLSRSEMPSGTSCT